MKGIFGVVMFLFLFITVSLASRKSLTSIGSKRLVPGGPDNATSPSNPPAFVTDIEIKRLVPGGPDNTTSPSNPPAVLEVQTSEICIHLVLRAGCGFFLLGNPLDRWKKVVPDSDEDELRMNLQKLL
ncbi:hypothetical protein YC2023_012077 [Brassica napus]